MRIFSLRFLRAVIGTPPRVLFRKTLSILRRRFEAPRPLSLMNGLQKKYRRSFFQDLYCSGRPRFFESPAPKAVEKHIKNAELLVGNKFALLGSPVTDLGAEVDWQRDFIHFFSFPEKHISRIHAHGYIGIADIKVPWELSRFQFLPTLAYAWCATQKDIYSQKAASLIVDWIEKNPFGIGVNWLCTMDVAIRACNWLLGWHMMRESDAFKARLFQESFFWSLLNHGRFIFRNLEYGGRFNSNHFTADVTGLLFLAVMLPEFHDAPRWKRFALCALEEEILAQTYPDGVNFEGSISYHRLVTELFGYCAMLCKNNGIGLSGDYYKRLEKMFQFARDYTKPNGLAPQIGDNDDGRLFIFEDFFEWERRDHRHLQWLEEKLFKKPAPLASTTSAAYEQGGIYILRSPRMFVLAECGPNGQKGNAGHAHNDTLSFELAADGEDIIVDPGTYVYTSNPRERNLFRSTAMHSTVRVDGEEMNRFRAETLFSMHDDAHPKVLEWHSSDARDILVALHTGYQRLAEAVSAKRRFVLDKRAHRLEIVDSFDGCCEHELEWNFHFAPGAALHPTETGFIIRKNTSEVVMNMPPQLRQHAEIIEGEVSPRYGVKEPALILRISHTFELPLREFIFSFAII